MIRVGCRTVCFTSFGEKSQLLPQQCTLFMPANIMILKLTQSSLLKSFIESLKSVRLVYCSVCSSSDFHSDQIAPLYAVLIIRDQQGRGVDRVGFCPTHFEKIAGASVVQVNKILVFLEFLEYGAQWILELSNDKLIYPHFNGR